MRTWIRGGKIITPDQTIEDSIVVIENERILAIEGRDQVAANPQETLVIDAAGLLVLPGLIDIHVHGGDGSDTMDATPESLEQMSIFFLKHGVTAFLPTTITNSQKAINRAIENVAQNRSSLSGARVLGLHLEGPYLGFAHRGAQPSDWLRSPNPDEYHAWLNSGLVRRVTLAPELPGALQFIREEASPELRFSVGHTEATYQEVKNAADAGLSQSTHTFNGMNSLHHREPGAVGAVLSDDRISCEVIADGIHLHPAVLSLVFRLKGVERTILVTDAMRAAGLEDGEYDLGGQMTTVKAGIARTANGSLAGSTLTLNRAVRNMMEFTGLSINQAVAMATTTPANSLGLSGQKGVIKPGADADIILVDRELNIKAAMIAGSFVEHIL